MSEKKDILYRMIRLFTIIIIMLSILSPVLSFGESNVQETLTSSTSQSLKKSDFLNEDSEETIPTLQSSEPVTTTTSEESSSDSAVVEEKVDEMKQTTEEEPSEQKIRASTTNILDAVVIKDWELYRDKGGKRESLTVEPKSNAESNQAYSFAFSWEIPSGKLGRNILPGDYFVLNIPQNENRDTGHWYAIPGEWSVVTTKDGTESVYRYRVESSVEQIIRIEFLKGVNNLKINTISSELNFQGFMNYVTKEGTQDVSFGRDMNGSALTKSINFNKLALKAANGFSFKYGAAGSNNSLKWGIQFNGAANLELAGDYVDYNVNGGAGDHQGFYTDKPGRDVWLPWGESYTDIYATAKKQDGSELGGYVEDDLPVGAEMTTLTIAAYIPIPIGLTQENYAKQEGVYSSGTAAFQSFVLSDYGKGPTYRSGTDNSEVQRPKAGTGFTLLEQKNGESKEDFKARIQAAPYQYGVYKSASGVSTVMMHYGMMKKGTNDQQNLNELTNSPTTGRSITNPISNKTVQITEFAAKAADFTIKRGYYAEEDRELLENYYSITFGDSNAIGGKIASYNISLTVRYPPNTPSGPIRNESAIYTHSALTLNREPPEEMPKINEATYTLQNPYGSITLNTKQALLQKFDVERDENDEYIPINGAKFKLQVKDGDTWTDVKKGDDVLTFTTDGINYYEVVEENGQDVTVEKTANGLIRVDFSELGLADGTYRFVETKAAPGYIEETKLSDEFIIPSATGRGPTVTVWNKKLPQVKYTVEHYVQKIEGNTAKGDFDLRKTEKKSGYLGQKVVGEPLLELLNSYEYSQELSNEHGLVEGTVTEDGQLILKLYYTIAAEVPFTFYKQGMNEEPMPSVDSSGKQLFDEQGRELKVTFDVYEYISADKLESWELGKGPKGNPTAWKKINTTPIATDALGRIRVPEITDLTKYYAIVEKETYPDYVLAYNDPAVATGGDGYREVYWVVQMNESKMFSAPNWANGTEVDKPDFETPSESNGNRYILKNRKSDISLFKVNEQGEAMPSTDQQKVQFDIYRWNSGGYFEENSSHYWEQWVKIKTNAVTDNQGYFATIGQTGLEGSHQKNFDWYLIRETDTYSGYQKSEGYWMVSTAWKPSTQKFEIFEVKYKVNHNGIVSDAEDPGHKISDDRTALYLTNKAKPVSFYKEDGKQNPLGGVHFSLYKVKDGEAGTSGSEDPEASDTKWDMANPIEKVSSDNAADKGQVTFDDLTSGDYLLKETKTLPGYQLPMGYWVVTVDFYGEIKTIRGRGDPLPPAFRVDNGKYYLPNYLKNSLPKAGGYLRVFLVVIGIVLLGSAGMVLQNRKKINDKKGKEDEKKVK